MKYLIFGAVLCTGVPLMAAAGAWSVRARGWLLTALVFSTVLGDMGNINFVSMEAYRGPDRGFEINLTDLIAWALIAAALLRPQGRVRWLPPNTWIIAAFIGLAALTTVMAPVPVYGAFTLVKLIRFYVLYWCVVNVLGSGTSRIYLWQGLMLIGITMTAFTLYQKYGLGIYRVHGPFDHSNTIPSYVNLILPVLLVWGIVDDELGQFRAWMSGLVALGLTFSVMATFSRAGIALSLMSIGGALLVALRNGSFGRVSVAAVVLTSIMTLGAIQAADSVRARFREAPESSMDARKEFNETADRMRHDHLLGVGLNNFSHVMTTTPRYRDHLSVMEAEEETGVVHNIYRLTAAEMGLPGLTLFVLMLARFTWLAAWRGWRNRGLAGALLLGCFLGFGTMHVTGFLEWTFRTTPVLSLFAVVAALVAVLGGVPRSTAVQAPGTALSLRGIVR